MTNRPKMRTLPKAFEELKAIDPQTDVTPYMLRQLVLQGKIPSVKAGRKFLLNLDVLFDFLGCKGENIE